MEPELIKYSWLELAKMGKKTVELKSEYLRIRKSILHDDRGFDLVNGFDPDLSRTLFASHYHRDIKEIDQRLYDLQWEVKRRSRLVGVI